MGSLLHSGVCLGRAAATAGDSSEGERRQRHTGRRGVVVVAAEAETAGRAT